MSKKPYVKKSQHKKKTIHTTHPYLEVMQEEITSLEKKLLSIEENEANNQSTSEEQTEKTVTKVCLERYQATLAKLTDDATESKMKSYIDSQQHRIKENLEKQVLNLLLFFYIMRLGQCGLFDQIRDTPPNMLSTISNLSDQLVGAAVYHQLDYHNTEKKHKIFDLLKKLDRGDDIAINSEEGIITTFKQVKELMRHIWKQVKTPQQMNKEEEEEGGSYGVLQFDGMIPSSSTATAAIVGFSKEEENIVDQEKAESPVENTIKQEGAAKEEDTTEKLASSDVVEKTNEEKKPKEETEEKNDDGWGSKPVQIENGINDWESKSKVQANSWNNEQTAASAVEEKEDEPEKEEVSGTLWDEKPKQYKFKEQFDSWNNVEQPSTSKQEDADRNGWTKSFDSTVQADKWDNTGSPNMSEGNIKSSSAATEEEQHTGSPILESAETESRSAANDDWRRRDNESHENSRGRGRGRGNYRGRGGGERGGRGRGKFFNQRGGRGSATNSTGRGRGGRGRGRPDHTKESSSTHQKAATTSSQ